MRHLRPPVLVSAIILASLCPVTARADVPSYVEDFTTRAHCDTLLTTARWDTLVGEIGLFPYNFTVVSAFGTSGTAADVAIAGNRVYVANGGAGLLVIDVSDPAGPTLAGSLDTPGTAESVAVAGNHACVADGTSGLLVIDVTDPSNPALAGSTDTPGAASDVAIAGNHAFVADGAAGLQVVDISDPTNPTIAGACDTPGDAHAVVICGNYAYVADGNAGLRVIDVTDPTNPFPAGSFSTSQGAVGLAVSGDRAFVAIGTGGVSVIDVSDPTDPVLMGGFGTPGSAQGITIVGDYAYIADDDGGLQVLDVRNVTTHQTIGSCDTGGEALGVVVAGEHAFVADGSGGMVVVDVRDRVDPVRVGSYGSPPSLGVFVDVAIDGNRAYVAEPPFRVIDITDPTNPVLLGSNDDVSARAIAIDGNHAFVATSDGLAVINVADPTDPYVVGSCDTLSVGYAVAVSGDHAFVAAAGEGLYVFDITDPAAPSLIATLTTAGGAYDLVVDGDHVFVAETSTGFSVIDVSDPGDPVLVTTINTPGSAVGLALAGDRIYVANSSNGLVVIDVSVPGSPVIVGSCEVGYTARDVAVDGDYAYVVDLAGYGASLYVVDVSDPTNPTVLAESAELPIEGQAVGVSGDYAYVVGDPQDLFYDDPFHVMCVLQGLVERDDDTARSLDIEPEGHDVAAVRLASTQVDSIRWQVSGDGGLTWGHILPDATWHELPAPGSELLWRSTHDYAGEGANPVCSHLQIDWLTSFPAIDSIVDVPNDQGGQVSMSWTRSGYDSPGSENRIMEYAVYRRIEDAARGARPGRNHERPVGDGRIGVPDAPTEPPSSLPAGDWAFVMTVPAFTEDEYAVVAPTFVDSSATAGMHYSTFFVRALTETPGIHYDCPPDSGYSVDNLSPGAPDGFALDYGASVNSLSWSECPEQDFDHFRIYRSTNPDFVPGDDTLVHVTGGTSWDDEVDEGWQYHYRITASDLSGNESDPTSPETVTGADSPVLPASFTLHQNTPNPFASGTAIRYDVPAGGGDVRLEIFDVSGRLVRVLHNGPVEAGRRDARWDGRDDTGTRVAAGVYYCRISALGYREALKMVVLR